jgi:hypothetical protein
MNARKLKLMINKDSNHKVEQYQYQAMEIIAI